MSKQTIIDWQRDGILATVGTGRGSSISIDQLSYQAIGEGKTNSSPQQALVVAAGELKHSKGPAVVLVPREMVEVRTIAVPRMDAAELPDVIRFQAQRQLANMGESWPIDYVLLPDAPDQEMLTALVSVIAPNELSQITSACESAGFQVSHVAPRPLEIARYGVASGNIPASGVSMLISVSGQSADLMILRDGQLVQIRGTKLPTEADQRGRAIQGELRRSLMAASSHISNSPLAGVMLLASAEVAADLQQAIQQATETDVTHVDPSQLLGSSVDAPDGSLGLGPRITAAAGAIAMPAADQLSVIDFKNPKKRPPPKSHRTTIMLAAAAGILLLLGGVSWWYQSHANLDAELEDSQIALETAKEDAKLAQVSSKEWDEIQKFLDASPNWLDELAYISDRIPASDKIQLGGTNFVSTNTGPQIRISQVAADSDTTLSKFEDSLRDDNHQVTSSMQKILPNPIGNYSWTVSPAVIHINGRGWKIEEIMRKMAKEKPAAASNSAATINAQADAPATPPTEDAEQPIASKPEDLETTSVAQPSSLESTPAEPAAKTTDAKATDAKATDAKATDDKTADDKTADDKTADEKTADEKTADESA